MLRIAKPFLICLLISACGATPNPKRPETPSPWIPPPKTSAAKNAPEASVAKASSATTSDAQTNADAVKPSSPAVVQKSEQAPSTKATSPSTPPTTKAPASTPDRAPTSDPKTTGDLVIATVAGQPIEVDELLAQWLHQDSIGVLEHLDQIVVTHLALAEAKRLSIKVDPDRAERAYDESVAAIEKQIAIKRPGMLLDKYVDRVLGLDPIAYRERLRDDALKSLIVERAARAYVLQSEHAFLRMIVVKTDEDVKAVQNELATGTAFEDVARKHSADPSAKDGGRIPPVIRSETAVGKLAFETKIGAIAGPQAEQGAWLFVKVDERPEPLSGNWGEIGAAVEKSLAERRIEELEFSQWRVAMLRRYDVDTKPFLKLAGEPTR